MTDIMVTVGPHVQASVGADGFRKEHIGDQALV